MIKRITLWILGSLLVGVTYLVALMIGGMLISILGIQLANAGQGADLLSWLFAGAILIGLVLGPIA